uniref:PDZ domain-containing protein n=1 Tax=Candidatus Electronema sp. TaxID=2698783 RepID=UPI0040571D5C
MATIVALFIVGLISFLVIRDKPFSDSSFPIFIRILLSLACAILGAVIPGFLSIDLQANGLLIRAGGALALFVITYFFTPQTVFPLDERKNKAEKAKQLITSEIIFNIKNLDTRLGFAEHSLSLDNTDNVKDRFDETRKKVAPAIESVAKENYGKLMSQQQAASLRATFNSYPLRTDLESSLVQVLVDGNVSHDRINAFYKDLREAQHQSEAMLETIGDIALASSGNKDTVAYQKRKIIFAKNMLKNRSQSAYLSGWIVLKNLEAPSSQLNDTIIVLQYLKPNRILSNSEITQLINESIVEAEQLLVERKYLVAEAKRITESALTAMADLEEKLKIQPTDTWNQVTGKAKTLRQLGRITDAVAVFSRYGEMFSDKDPSAKQYAKTAQLFTTQIADLKLDGGIYIYEISKNSIAEKAGFKIGDIIIDYNGKITNEMDDLITALKNSPKDEMVRITFLRIDDNGAWIQVPSAIFWQVPKNSFFGVLKPRDFRGLLLIFSAMQLMSC